MQPDSLVSVTVSTGPTSVEVPYLAGLDRSEAGSTLAEAGLKLGAQTEAPDDDALEGEIVGQEPAAGMEAKRGSSVSITISSRPQEVTVPDLTGQRLPQARDKLVKASLKLGGEDEAPSDTVLTGGIIKQEPAAGTQVEQGSSVRVTVSSGPEKTITTPDVPPRAREDDRRRRRWRPRLPILLSLLIPLLVLIVAVYFMAGDSVEEPLEGDSYNEAAAPVINNAPVPNNDAYSVGVNQSLTVDAPGVFANDTDSDNDSLKSIIVDSPTNGFEFRYNKADGSFTYNPDLGFIGEDFFTYRLSDGTNESDDVATVTITVVG